MKFDQLCQKILLEGAQPELVLFSTHSVIRPNVVDKNLIKRYYNEYCAIPYKTFIHCSKNGFIAKCGYGKNSGMIDMKGRKRDTIAAQHVYYSLEKGAYSQKYQDQLGVGVVAFKKHLNEIFLDDESDIGPLEGDPNFFKIDWDNVGGGMPLSELKLDFSDPRTNEEAFYGNVVYDIKPNEIIDTLIDFEYNTPQITRWCESIVKRYQKIYPKYY